MATISKKLLQQNQRSKDSKIKTVAAEIDEVAAPMIRDYLSKLDKEDRFLTLFKDWEEVKSDLWTFIRKMMPEENQTIKDQVFDKIWPVVQKIHYTQDDVNNTVARLFDEWKEYWDNGQFMKNPMNPRTFVRNKLSKTESINFINMVEKEFIPLTTEHHQHWLEKNRMTSKIASPIITNRILQKSHAVVGSAAFFSLTVDMTGDFNEEGVALTAAKLEALLQKALDESQFAGAVLRVEHSQVDSCESQPVQSEDIQDQTVTGPVNSMIQAFQKRTTKQFRASMNYNVKFKSEKGHSVYIDVDHKYGYFELPDGSEGGGLWFESHDGNPNHLILIDFDGMTSFPTSIAKAMLENGFALSDYMYMNNAEPVFPKVWYGEKE